MCVTALNISVKAFSQLIHTLGTNIQYYIHNKLIATNTKTSMYREASGLSCVFSRIFKYDSSVAIFDSAVPVCDK